MHRVAKYDVFETHQLPKGYEVLTAAAIPLEGIFVWVKIKPPISEMVPVRFILVGTGITTDQISNGRYITTLIQNGVEYHLFEIEGGDDEL